MERRWQRRSPVLFDWLRKNLSTQAQTMPLYIRIKEKIIVFFLAASSFVSVFITALIIYILFSESAGFFKKVPLGDFLFGTRWSPLLEPASYGVLPLINGTFLVTAGALIIALPVGLLTAIYLSEYASNKTRQFLKPVLEILSGIPTVVYGYFALTFITPILQTIIPITEVFNAASASIVVGIMTLPIITSLSDDALQTVPRSLREGAYALGATRFEVSTQIVLISALPRVGASVILAVSRAIGETMAVTLAAGATPKMTANIFESVQTMTAYIVEVSLGDTPQGTIGYQTSFAVGLLLFIITLTLNFMAQRLLYKKKH